jgi:hypothetical protein
MQTNLLIMEMERIWGWGTTFGDTKQARSFFRIMIESYLAPTIIDLGLVCRNHRDALKTILPSFYDPYRERYNKASTELMAIVSASQAIHQESERAKK